MLYRFLLDENIPLKIYHVLREKGSIVEYVPRGVDDDTVIEIAKRKNYILVTRDNDFADDIMYPPKTHPGIIVLRIHPPLPSILSERLVRALELLEDINGEIIVIYNDRIEIIS